MGLPTAQEHLSILQMKKPSPLPKFMVLVQPFREDLWAGVISTMTVCFAITVCIGFLYPSSCNHYSYKELIFYLVGTFLDQAQQATFKFQSNALRKVIFEATNCYINSKCNCFLL